VHVAKKAFRCLYWFLACAYLAAALSVLGLRYLVLPRIDDFRPRIEAEASQALGAPVAIGGVHADWTGLNPRLRLRDVTVQGPQGGIVLTVPEAAAVLSWRSVFALDPVLLSLEIRGLDLAVRRDAQAQLWVAGRPFTPPRDEARPALDSPALLWLLDQRELVLRDATVRWRDELRGAPELVLDGVDVRVRNGLLEHAFSATMRPPRQLAAALSVRGALRRRLLAGDGGKASSWDGEVYAQVDDADPAAWSAWFDVPAVQGRMAGRAWLDIDRGRPSALQADLALKGAGWQQPGDGGAGVSAASVLARVKGAPGDLAAALAGSAPAGPLTGDVAVEVDATDVALRLPGIFADPVLPLHAVQADVTLSRPAAGPASIQVRRFAARNDDASISVQGVWRNDAGAAGSVDLHGTMDRASMPAIHRYLPLAVDEDVRNWLREGLLAGRVAGASFTLRGALADFPFRDASAGQFRVEGSFDDAALDYAPARPDRPAWPVLSGLAGTFEIERTALRLRAQAGLALTGPGQTVALEQVRAEIPDMEHHATLVVQGDTRGEAPAYLAMMVHSPLGALLDHALDQAQGTGRWQVPLSLRIPLYDVGQAEVSGSVVFDGASLALHPDMPAFEALQGALRFSERGVATDDLQGRFVGGPLRATGELAPGAAGMRVHGRVTADGLRRLADVPALRRLSGGADYEALLTWRAASAIDVTVRSSLQGLGIDLPAPLGKPAAAARALRVQWGPARDSAARALTADLDPGLRLQLEADPRPGKGPYFRRGSVSADAPARMPAQGLGLSGKFAELDLAAWREAAALFSPVPRAGQAGSAGAFPDVTQVWLQAGRVRTAAIELDDVTLQAARGAGAVWQAEIASRQVAGTAQWTPADRQSPARLVARLQRLALGESGADESEDDDSDFGDDDFSDMPDVDLTVQDFALYGKSLGTLALAGGRGRGAQQWQLRMLQVHNDAAKLDASGTWRLAGRARGLSADVRVDVADLGKLLARLGLPEHVTGGHGSLRGKLDWRDLPWHHRYADLSGTLDVALEKGRLSHVNSPGARLLELLSLQSVQRLARLDVNPGSLLREGFPFDTIGSQITLGGGLARTDGLKVDSPLATIVLAGSTDLSAETWNLEAAVVPKLDASGAAIAAGIAVNPLIGLGAFVTQWLLKEPLARALTSQYTVRGSWDDPKLEPVDMANKYGGRDRAADYVEP